MKKIFYLVLIIFLVGCEFNLEEIPEDVPPTPPPVDEEVASESPQDTSPLADVGNTERGTDSPSTRDTETPELVGINPSDVSGEVDCPPDETDILHPWEIRLCNFIERRKQ